MSNPRPLIAAGSLIGMGMGGFLDGILFHQIFQFHNMLSGKIFPDTLINTEINMFWDGVFHAFTWTLVAAGILLLFEAARRKDVPWSRQIFFGALAFGYGFFNFVEGLLDHHLFQIHHVVERADPSTRAFFDYAFLASGVLLIGVGRKMIRSTKAGAG